MVPSAVLEPVAPRGRSADPEPFYEVVKGQRVELLPLGAYPTWVASVLLYILTDFVQPNRLGVAVNETLFLLKDGEEATKRRPDVAFVSLERWPADREIPDEEAWDVVPNLAVEVISKTERFYNVLEKVRDYFEAGVEAVWCVVPREQLVYVYESPTRVTILDRDGELDGGTVLPGFRLPVARLFRKFGSAD